MFDLAPPPPKPVDLAGWEQVVENSASGKIYQIEEKYLHDTIDNDLKQNQQRLALEKERAQIAKLGAPYTPDQHDYTKPSSEAVSGWCDVSTWSGKVAADLKKAQILGTYEGYTLTSQDVKFLGVIQIDWEQKEKEAQLHCTSSASD